MATARELLEQADAVMRRNRAAAGGAAPIAAEAPGLVEVARTGTADAASGSRGEAARTTNVGTVSVRAANAPLDDFDDIPVLTDAVTDRDPISVLGGPEYSGEPSVWPDDAAPKRRYDDWSAPLDAEASPGEQRADGTAKEPAESAAPVPLDDEELRFTVEPAEHAVTESAVEADAAAVDAAPATHTDRPNDQARWDALAEEVRIQVLQRLDIFTDTGLQEQLTARLQPIVDRASDDLVAAINRDLGELLRAYVAEAIEREIEKLTRG